MQRPEHLKQASEHKKAGRVLFGGAIMDEKTQQRMVGSCMLWQVESREELRRFLEKDPYVKGRVWQSIIIRPFKMADF